jgi:hypothetical protein
MLRNFCLKVLAQGLDDVGLQIWLEGLPVSMKQVENSDRLIDISTIVTMSMSMSLFSTSVAPSRGDTNTISKYQWLIPSLR